MAFNLALPVKLLEWADKAFILPVGVEVLEYFIHLCDELRLVREAGLHEGV